MRLPVDGKTARLTLMTVASVIALGAGVPAMAGLNIPFFGGKKNLPPAPAMPDQPRALTGPAADYPVVLGAPYKVGDRLFTPSNAMNYDTVGYAAVDGPAMGVSAAHHTLPLPSYVEVTSLATGRTILVRVERRGPMDSVHAIALSPQAAAQLGLATDGKAAVRVRRVNPLEAERATLRAGGSVAERMVTPKALLAVLQRRLANDPMAGHAGASLTQSAMAGAAREDDEDSAKPVAPVKSVTMTKPASKLAIKSLAPKAVPAKPAGAPPLAGVYFTDHDGTVRKPVPASAQSAPVAPAPKVAPALPVPAPPAPVTRPVPEKSYLIRLLSQAASVSHSAASAPEPRVSQPLPSGGTLVVQIGAFGDKARAHAVARKAGASLFGTGKLWRVRMGPFANRGQAEAALAKARAAGYTEARIQHGE